MKPYIAVLWNAYIQKKINERYASIVTEYEQKPNIVGE